ncbi:MAG: VWA domain-containing protein [Crocinitomicaceae bacterium]|nr:VWA domain-containing protein [Crocinitomicaceae bacterium]
MELLLTYHPIWIFVITLLAAIFPLALYYKDKLTEDASKTAKFIMAIFRFFAVWMILFLVLGIVIEHTEERTEEPLIVIASDNSESVVMHVDSNWYRTEYPQAMNNLSVRLQEKFEVAMYSFSDLPEGDLKTDFTGKSTDIAKALQHIFEQYANRNIGAIILATDGIYNTGANPIYTVSEKSFVPVYTIGLGDTSLQRDAKIDLVNHNKVAFMGNDFPVEINFSGVKTQGENIQISLRKGNDIIASQAYKFNSDYDQSKIMFMVKAKTAGLQKYTAVISTVDGEYTTRNNVYNFYVEVIDGRQKILLAHDAPHPDIAALRFVIENNENYEAEVKYFKEITNLTEYDLVVVHNYQSGNTTLDEAILNGTVPFLLINGTSTNMSKLQSLKVGFSGNGNSTEELGFAVNTSFRDILLSPKIIQTLSSAPPLHAPFGNLSYSNALDILAFQKVGNIQLDQPLIYFTTKEKSRLGVIMGEGIWRWRLYDQQRNKSTLIFEEFTSKLITYLAVKENKDPFKINIENEYNENEEIKISAELYNKSYELIRDAEINFTLTDQDSNEFKLAFLPSPTGYQLNLGKLKSGIYQWKANTKFSDQTYSKAGNFLVNEVRLEWINTTANHRLLRNISENTSGKFYFPDQTDLLAEEILNSKEMVSVVYQEKTFDDIIDFRWLFFVIMSALAAEWFYRKYSGGY